MFECPRCGYNTNIITNFIKHLSKKIICNPLNPDISIDDIKNELINKKLNSFECEGCHKKYSSKDSLRKHIRICKVLNIDTKNIKNYNINNINTQKDINIYQEILNLKKEVLNLKLTKYSSIASYKNIYENEKFYQLLLEKYLDGKHKKISCGITDITTSDCHVEIKIWNKWKEAVGQLTCYNIVDPKPTIAIYFFGKYNVLSKNKALDIIKKCNIHPYEFIYSSDKVDLIDLIDNNILYSQKIDI